MALVSRIAIRLPNSDRWAANLSAGGMSYRYLDQGTLKWIRLTKNNTRISKMENGRIVWQPVI